MRSIVAQLKQCLNGMARLLPSLIFLLTALTWPVVRVNALAPESVESSDYPRTDKQGWLWLSASEFVRSAADTFPTLPATSPGSNSSGNADVFSLAAMPSPKQEKDVKLKVPKSVRAAKYTGSLNVVYSIDSTGAVRRAKVRKSEMEDVELELARAILEHVMNTKHNVPSTAAAAATRQMMRVFSFRDGEIDDQPTKSTR